MTLHADPTRCATCYPWEGSGRRIQSRHGLFVYTWDPLMVIPHDFLDETIELAQSRGDLAGGDLQSYLLFPAAAVCRARQQMEPGWMGVQANILALRCPSGTAASVCQRFAAEPSPPRSRNSPPPLGGVERPASSMWVFCKRTMEGGRGKATQQQQRNPNQNKISGHIYPPSLSPCNLSFSPVRRNRPIPDCPLTGPRHHIFEVRAGGEDSPGGGYM